MTTVQTTLYHRIDEPNSRNDLADYHISIVIPVFNESRHIKQVLESIPSYIRSIIVVDDGSTDDTLHKIEGFQRKYNDKKRRVADANRKADDELRDVKRLNATLIPDAL